MSRILCLDLDGVLHPADCRVLLDFSAPGWQLATQARTQGLLRWTADLEAALAGSDAKILVHSTWRRRTSDQAMRELLGPELGPRVISTDRWISPQERESLSHAAYIDLALNTWQEIEGWKIESVCVLDDRPSMFQEDAHLLTSWNPQFIWTNPALGVSDAGTQDALSQWTSAPVMGWQAAPPDDPQA